MVVVELNCESVPFQLQWHGYPTRRWHSCYGVRAYFIWFITEFEGVVWANSETAFLPAGVSDIGGFISVAIAVSQNYLRKLGSKWLIRKGGTSSITCSERTVEEGELGLWNNSKTGYTSHQQNKSPVAGNVFCGKKRSKRRAKLSCSLYIFNLNVKMKMCGNSLLEVRECGDWLNLNF